MSSKNDTWAQDRLNPSLAQARRSYGRPTSGMWGSVRAASDFVPW